jgi:3-oxoacyl-[acyl-carrier-protein] synthase II
MTTRVAITGIGCVTPIGTGVTELQRGLDSHTSAVRSITRFDPTPFRSRIAGEIPDFRPSDHLSRRSLKRFDRFSQLGVAAARLALEDSGIDPSTTDRDRFGVMMGSALGGIAFGEEQAERYRVGGLQNVQAHLALSVFGGAVSCNIAIEWGLTGPNATNAMSCASGAVAIGEALRSIRGGYSDIMLTGGSEAPLSPLCFASFTLIRAMSTRNDDPATASRPFDRDRDGFVMSEGSAVLVLERHDRAIARGARVYGELLGYGLTNDGYHMTAPKPSGREAARAMTLALDDARVRPEEIDYINAHGSSTPLNDSTETEAIKRVFGDHAYRLAVSGTKGYYGHALGASGAFEAAICATALSRQSLPPSLNLRVADDACDLNYVRNGRRAERLELALSNSFGFGGVNAALVLRK